MLLLSVFINSCTKDNFSSTVKQKEKSIAKAISINDLREDLNRNTSIDLNKISAQSAMGQSIEDFIIDTTKILLTNNDRNESFYSMRLHSKKRNSRKYFYNLFIIKDSIGQFKKYIIKFTPTLETIKNGYKNFKGSYEILKDVSSSSGQIKSNSTNIISNSTGCYEVAYDIPCIYGYVHGEGNGPGPWCDGGGSYKLFLDVCSGSGSVGYTTGTTNNGSNNGTGGNNVLITPTYEYDIVHCEDSNADDFIFNTYLQHQTWANSNINDFNQIVGSICGNSSSQSMDIVSGILNFLEVNSVSWIEYKNWFAVSNEGKDGYNVEADLVEYETPIVPQNLPMLSQWIFNFPKINNTTPMPSYSVYQLVGGSIYNSFITDSANYRNACAIRGSRALIYSGITIPVLKYGNPPVQVSQKGGDNKNYILSATHFNKFMIDTFGDTPLKLVGPDANNPTKVAELLRGKNGIYVIVNANPTIAGYSGHVDAIIEGRCISNAYASPNGGVKSIRIWQLNN